MMAGRDETDLEEIMRTVITSARNRSNDMKMKDAKSLSKCRACG